MFSFRLIRTAAILLGVAVLSACGGDSTSPTLTPTPTLTLTRTTTFTPMQTVVFQPTVTPSVTATATSFPTFDPQSAGALARPTLPPTWTPTPTVTPSLTPTITSTPTITPTRTINEFCDSGVDLSFNWELRSYQVNEAAPIFASTDDPNTTIVFEAVNQADETITVEFTLPGGDLYFAGVPMEIFPEAGIYDWTMSVTRGEESGLCAIQGTVTLKSTSLLDLIRGANPTVTSTPEN